jgi:hypothetical protein
LRKLYPTLKVVEGANLFMSRKNPEISAIKGAVFVPGEYNVER